MATTLWTIGHSTRTLPELIGFLQEHGIRLLVDVRRFPGSRRHPQFGKESLAEGMGAAGIAYRHEPDLGGRRQPLPDSPNLAWRSAGFRGVADHLATETGRRALERLAAEAERQPTAILCAEAHPSRCHRRVIADSLVARGLVVFHILALGSTVAHQLDPSASIGPTGDLTYPAAPELQPSLFEG
jgi:uncharacterized protein (DUF488 family)